MGMGLPVDVIPKGWGGGGVVVFCTQSSCMLIFQLCFTMFIHRGYYLDAIQFSYPHAEVGNS